MKTPESTQRLATELLAEPNVERLEKLKLALGGKAAWRGPFAWSLLVDLKGYNTIGTIGTILAEAAWAACKVVHAMESNLTLKPFDFDRLLCALIGRLLEFQEVWPFERFDCCSLLGLVNLALGKDFLETVPRIFTKDSSILPISITCLVYWIRLYSTSRGLDFTRIEEVIFGGSGVIDGLKESFDDSKRIAGLFLFHWRLAARAILCHENTVDRLLLVEGKIYKELPEHLKNSEETNLSRWKSLTDYLSNHPVKSVEQLFWDFDFCKMKQGDQYLSRLENLSDAALEMISGWDNAGGTFKSIVQLILILKSKDFEANVNFIPLDVSLPVETWISQYCGKNMSKSPAAAKVVLKFLNSYSVIRSDISMRAYEICLRIMAQNLCQEETVSSILTGVKRYIKLGIHFNSHSSGQTNPQDSVFKAIISIAKSFAVNGNGEISAKILNSFAKLGMHDDHESLVADTWASISTKNNSLDFPTDESILVKFIQLLPQKIADPSKFLHRILSQHCSRSIRISCHLAMLNSKAATNVASTWVKLAEEQFGDFIYGLNGTSTTSDDSTHRLDAIGICFVWKHLAKLNVEADVEVLQGNSDSRFESEQLSTMVSILLWLHGYSDVAVNFTSSALTLDYKSDQGDGKTIIEISKLEYSRGNIRDAYERANGHFQSILTSIKTHPVSLLNVWLRYHELFNTLEWLMFLCDSVGAWRLTKYYIKAGLTFTDSLNLTNRKSHHIQFQKMFEEKLQVPGLRVIEKTFVDPKDLLDTPDWIDFNIARLSQKVPCDDLPVLKIFRESGNKGCPASFLDSLLDRTWKCGSGLQFRRVVCAIILEETNPDYITRLIELVKRKEFCDPLSMDWGSVETAFNELNNEQPSLLVSLLVDADRNILYISRLFLGVQSVLRLKLPGSFLELYEQLQKVVEDNKIALFKPGTLPVDESTKRAWWIARHELENRLDEIVNILERWIAPAAPFLVFSAEDVDFSSSLNTTKKLCNILKCCKSSNFENFLSEFELDENTRLMLLNSAKYNKPKIVDDLNPFVTPVVKSKPVIKLVLDRYLHDFPWESRDFFADALVVRSFSSLLDATTLESVAEISAIVNPGGDLKRTEEQLTPLLSEMSLGQIISGRSPTQNEMQNILTDSDLFLYFGHGSGDAYLPINEISKLPRCSSAFLFGCSSGRLKPSGLYNPEGALLAFQTAKSPLLLVNLWDVTDRDIDKLTVAFLRDLDLPGSNNVERYATSLQKSRDSCLLRLLNGAAPVLYVQ